MTLDSMFTAQNQTTPPYKYYRLISLISHFLSSVVSELSQLIFESRFETKEATFYVQTLVPNFQD